MNTQEKIRYILRKYPKTKYSRGLFTWKYAETFYGVKVYALKRQWIDFFKEYSSIERAYREVLKTEEFSLPPTLDAHRYKRSAEFKKDYKNEDNNNSEPRQIPAL